MITSVQNETIKSIAKLKMKKHRDEQHSFLIEGEHLVEEAFRLGIVQRVLTLDEFRKFDVETLVVSEAVMKSLSDVSTPPGIIAVCTMPNLDSAMNRVLLLDGIQDPGNMGTLIRSAVAFGFDAVITQNSVDFANPKVIRATQGAWFKLRLESKNILDFIRENPRLTIFSTDVEKGTDIANITSYPKHLALVIGSESEGVSGEVQSLSSILLHIPMEQTESLNAGVAGSILMYDIFQKSKKENS